MTSKLDRLNKLADSYVDDADIDLNEGKESGGDFLLPSGRAMARLVEYVEFGPQLNKKFPDKEPTNQFRLAFAIWGKGKDKDGNDATFHSVDGKVIKPGIIRTRSLAIWPELNTKANAFKLFKRMNPEKKAKHFAQLLNNEFILDIQHNTAKDAQGKDRVYANIDLETIQLNINPMSGEPLVKIPEVTDEDMFRVFLWDKPTQEDWDSLFIEGKSDDGKSKNFVQDLITSSPKYPGSPLELLLTGASSAVEDLPDLEVTEELPVEPEVKTKPKGKGKKVEPEPEPEPEAPEDFELPSL